MVAAALVCHRSLPLVSLLFLFSFFPSLSVWTPTHCKSVWSSQCLSFSLFLNSLSHKLRNHFSGSYFSLSGLFFWVLTRFSTPLPAYLHCSLFASHRWKTSCRTGEKDRKSDSRMTDPNFAQCPLFTVQTWGYRCTLNRLSCLEKAHHFIDDSTMSDSKIPKQSEQYVTHHFVSCS